MSFQWITRNLGNRSLLCQTFISRAVDSGFCRSLAKFFCFIPYSKKTFVGVLLKKTLPKKNEECVIIIPLLNNVLYFLFLYSDHLYFLESSFWIYQQLVCYWKAQNISSDFLPVSMINIVTSDFLACGIQRLFLYWVFFCIKAFIVDFFSSLCASLLLWGLIQIPLKISGQLCSQTLDSYSSGTTVTSDYFPQNW